MGCVMTYSVDLRQRVVSFVREGGSKVEAARRFNVGRSAVYDWLNRETLEPKVHGRRKRKLDWEALKADVKAHLDALLRERAQRFDVHHSSIAYALGQMKITVKKRCVIASGMPKSEAFLSTE